MREELEAFIALGEKSEGNGVTLLDEVVRLRDGSEMDARTEQAMEAGRKCRRFQHIKFEQGHGGWARGASRQVDVSARAMCFRLARPFAGPLYVTVEYLDRGVRPFSITRGGEPVHGALLGTGEWEKFTALVPAVQEEQPFDVAVQCDEPMWISRVEVSSQQPAGYEEPAEVVMRRAIEAFGPRGCEDALPRIAAPVGNIGSIRQEQDDTDMRSLRAWLPIYKGLGITSIQSYVRWSLIEPEPGKFDWSYYDRAVELLARYGLKWVAFIMIGPMYATPEWFRRSDKSVYVKCLEHGRECPVQSIWNPDLLEYVDRFFALAGERYGKSGMVESLMLGPSGDFGETTYNALFVSKSDDYHTHLGYWCGDDYARRDLARHLEEQYGALDTLNQAWGTRFNDWAEIQPFMPSQSPNRQAEIDFNDWYVGSMTRWSERWAEIASRHFPGVPIYHAAGGSGDPIHGGDWSDQAKAAAPHGVGLRVTNEGTPYAFNFIYTRWAAAACKHYGAPFGNEPWGGDWSAIGNVGRMYNAMTSGADQFWTYAGHLHTAECIEAFRRFRHLLKSEETMVDVAVYYPKLHFALTDEHAFGEDKARSIFWAQGEELRDLTDFDIVDSTLIGDGALERYRFLILLQGKTMKRADLEQIEDWLKRGGVLVSHDFGPICDEAGEEWRERLLGGEGEQVTPDCLVLGVGSGAAVSYTRCADLHGTEGDHKDHPATEPAFLEMIAGILRWPQSVLHDIAPRIEPDCEMDGVFATRLRDAVLYLNTNAGPVAKRIAGPGLDQVVRVPGYSILRVPLDLASRAGP